MSNQTIDDDAIREVAGKIMRSHLEDVESLSIAEMMADDDRFKNLPEDDFDAVQKRVDDAIGAATVTIGWPGTSATAIIGPADGDSEAAWHVIRRYVGPDLFNAVDAELIEHTHPEECRHLPPWAVCWFNHEPYHSWWPVGLGTWRIRPVEWRTGADNYHQSMEIQAWDEATQTWHDWDGTTVGEAAAATAATVPATEEGQALLQSHYATAVELLGRLVDHEDTRCRLDHNGYCQEHNLSKPCDIPEARELLARIRGEQS